MFLDKLFLIKDLYICKYDDDNIGLFKKYDYKVDKKRECGFTYYDSGEIYVGYNNDKLGIKVTHDYDVFTNFWADNGYEIDLQDNHIVTNCQIQNGKSIRDIRVMMYIQGLIDDITSPILSEQEITETVNFVKDFYIKNKTKVK